MTLITTGSLCMVVQWLSDKALDLRTIGYGSISTRTKLRNNLGQIVHTNVLLSPSSITWYRSKDDDVLRLGRRQQAWQKVMPAYRRDDLKSHLWADCLYTGIIIGPNA